MSEEFLLSGDAVLGVAPHLTMRHMTQFQLASPVKLGRRGYPGAPQAVRLEDYVNLGAMGAIPESADWYTKAAGSISRMYLNDRYGICVFASRLHCLGIWSANDTDSGPMILATDNEAYQQYQSVCGPGDNGCYMPVVNDYMRTQGVLAGGKRYKIEGYVSCNPRSKELTQVGIQLFGAGVLGFSLPQAWLNSAVWEISNSRIVGGHEVCTAGYGKIVGYTQDGVIISSWGRLYLFTWAAWLSGRYIDEFYFLLPQGIWTGLDQRAPNGVMLTTLRQNLSQLGRGEIPPLPDPNPPPVPPVPPIPAGPQFDGVIYSTGGVVFLPDGRTCRPFEAGAGNVPLSVWKRGDKLYIGAGPGGGPRLQVRNYASLAVEWDSFVGDPNSRTGVNLTGV
jgi:hypothetical protein